MKASVIYLGIFTAGLLTDLQVDWTSWFWGLACGLSVANIAIKFLED